MPRFGPIIKRKELIHYLKVLDFEGSYSGGKHQFMIKNEIVLRVPNPHQDDIGKELLSRVLRQAGIDRKIWEKL
jgi:predicted RNA binding protein YcfA (HicA-like mRNA interferase family)